MGRITGLEPATFGTTNQRSNQLSYIRHTESFLVELIGLEPTSACCMSSSVQPVPLSFFLGGADRTRTDDPLHAMQVLYQLSYNPMQANILYAITQKVKLNYIKSVYFYQKNPPFGGLIYI